MEGSDVRDTLRFTKPEPGADRGPRAGCPRGVVVATGFKTRCSKIEYTTQLGSMTECEPTEPSITVGLVPRGHYLGMLSQNISRIGGWLVFFAGQLVLHYVNIVIARIHLVVHSDFFHYAN
jgi:hypothetical protein